jgi:hypothetical protein
MDSGALLIASSTQSAASLLLHSKHSGALPLADSKHPRASLLVHSMYSEASLRFSSMQSGASLLAKTSCRTAHRACIRHLLATKYCSKLVSYLGTAALLLTWLFPGRDPQLCSPVMHVLFLPCTQCAQLLYRAHTVPSSSIESCVIRSNCSAAARCSVSQASCHLLQAPSCTCSASPSLCQGSGSFVNMYEGSTF